MKTLMFVAELSSARPAWVATDWLRCGVPEHDSALIVQKVEVRP